MTTHGFLDSERPGLSALVLSMVDAQGKPQDGFLRANDIYNLKLPAELVVLSACQAGLGKNIKGERPAAALRAAQVEMWKQTQWQLPYYWAAFTIQGEWR